MSLSQPRLLAHNIRVRFGSYTDTGDLLLDENSRFGTDGDTAGAVLVFDSCNPDPDMIGPPEVISTSLTMYGLTVPAERARPACWIKDWSEHEGLAQSLVDAGVARIVASADNVGPHSLRAHLIEITV